MLPSLFEIFLFLLIGAFIDIAGRITKKLNKKAGIAVSICLALIAAALIIYTYSFQGFPFICLVSYSYSTMSMFLEEIKDSKQLMKGIKHNDLEEVKGEKEFKRLFADLGITAIVYIGAILFYFLGPDANVLKIIILFGVIGICPKIVKRAVNYYSVKVYYSSSKRMLFISSWYESRIYPINDLTGIQVESTADLLKLHHLLTLFSSKKDFTTSFQKVLRLSFPGEDVFLTIHETDKWKAFFEEQMDVEKTAEIAVLPFYHPKNMKRLIAKVYFAATVKGVSAYSGLLLILYFFHVSEWIILAAAILFWLFNLAISDLVLKTAMDATEINDPQLKETALKIFTKAGISNVQLYETDSAEYNGFATGLNIGRSMITLTTATLKLPMEVIEGILAHETVHVKKRDVLWGQLFRTVYIGIIFVIILYIKYQIPNIENYQIQLFLIFWALFFIYPMIQSFFSQWMEVRADHLGSSFLPRGAEQMAESLSCIAGHQDMAIAKTIEYTLTDHEEGKNSPSSLERGKWWLRILEFQFMPHPPMYWRVQALKRNHTGWSKKIVKRWIIDRMKESWIR